jgi:AGZA family xanthine/uracil permease-like MFS transporter
MHAPGPVFGDVFALLSKPEGWAYISIIIPMGLFNVIGSLQNLESAEAAGDRYETRPSLLANGLGTLVAAMYGSPFPTTIYIGHPGWKTMGARAGYSIINGIVIAALCMVGGVTLMLKIVPIEAMLGILLWIGVIITAQAFEAIDKRHCLAVAVGLIPAFAAWGLDMLVNPLLLVGKVSLAEAIDPMAEQGMYLHGMIALSQGFIVTSMVLAAALAFVIDRAFLKAAAWTFAAAVLSGIGLIHAYTLTEAGVRNQFIFTMVEGKRVVLAAPGFALMYALGALFLVAMHLHHRRHVSP